MSYQANRRSPKLRVVVALAALSSVLLSGCGVTAVMGPNSGYNQEYEYTATDSEQFSKDQDSATSAESATRLLVDFYHDPVDVRVLPEPAEVPHTSAAVSSSYVPDSANSDVLTVRGVTSDGNLIGILGPQIPKAGQIGPISGILGTQSGSTFEPFPTPDSASSQATPNTIGQVATSDETVLWSQTPTGSQQWSVYLQNGTGSQQTVTLPNEPWTLLDQSLQVETPSNGALFMFGVQKTGDSPTTRHIVQKLGAEPNQLSIDGQDAQLLALTSSGLITVDTSKEAPMVSMENSFWLAGSFYMDTLRYRSADQVHGLAVSGPLVAISAANGDQNWIDLRNLENGNQVTRVPTTGPVSSLQMCGQRIGWIAQTSPQTSVAYVLDSTSNKMVTLSTAQSAGELFCSASTFAVTQFDADGAYTGAEVTKFD